MPKQGFTVLELLIVIMILGIIAALAMSPFTHFRDQQVMRVAVEDVLSTLAKARTQTLAGLDDSAYGVHLDADQLVLFAGENYSPSDASNEVISLPHLVNISEINLAGGADDVVFARLTGATAQSGTVTLSLTSNASSTQTVIITPAGIASPN